ncbi:hypothetical protein MTBSS4_40132 [Magnetospirillum sp. SS-4]|nr:hypothetical protein MTBSS4_40132 [Magnetospirillum sp. SS-4]
MPIAGYGGNAGMGGPPGGEAGVLAGQLLPGGAEDCYRGVRRAGRGPLFYGVATLC